MLRLGLDPGYVLDRMEIHEIRALMEHSHLKERALWECSRFIGFVIANAMGAKLKKFTDLAEFPWEKGKDPEESEEEKAAHIRRLEEAARYYEGIMKRRNGKD